MSTQPETLDHIPEARTFTALSDHQAQTPVTFFGGPAVLHATIKSSHVLISSSTLRRHEAFRSIRDAAGSSTSKHTKTNGDSAESEEEIEDARIENMLVLEGVEGFITSQSLLLFTPSASRAISVPYPSISLHATQRLSALSTSSPQYTTPSQDRSTHEVQALYLQIDPCNPSLRNPADDEADSETVELLIIPQGDAQANAEQVKETFEALSRCADMHPDAGTLGEDEDGEGGGLSAVLGGMSGSGGWITAENTREFEGDFEDEEVEEMDGENGPEELGPGAGVRRARDDGLNGDGDDAEVGVDETKWQRTE